MNIFVKKTATLFYELPENFSKARKFVIFSLIFRAPVKLCQFIKRFATVSFRVPRICSFSRVTFSYCFLSPTHPNDGMECTIFFLFSVLQLGKGLKDLSQSPLTTIDHPIAPYVLALSYTALSPRTATSSINLSPTINYPTAP